MEESHFLPVMGGLAALYFVLELRYLKTLWRKYLLVLRPRPAPQALEGTPSNTLVFLEAPQWDFPKTLSPVSKKPSTYWRFRADSTRAKASGKAVSFFQETTFEMSGPHRWIFLKLEKDHIFPLRMDHCSSLVNVFSWQSSFDLEMPKELKSFLESENYRQWLQAPERTIRNNMGTKSSTYEMISHFFYPSIRNFYYESVVLADSQVCCVGPLREVTKSEYRELEKIFADHNLDLKNLSLKTLAPQELISSFNGTQSLQRFLQKKIAVHSVLAVFIAGFAALCFCF